MPSESRVQPVELARKLAKEMEENKVVSISRTYVPNEYVVFLSPTDREQFTSYEGALKKELSDYLLEHARNEGLALVTRPTVEFRTDERLSVGEFGIQAHLIQPPDEEDGEHEPQQADFGHTMVYSPDREARKLVEAPSSGRAMLVGEGRRTVLSGARVLWAKPGVRRRAGRPERVAPPCGAAPPGRHLDRPRPGLHQRHQGQRRGAWSAPCSSRATRSSSALSRLTFEQE